jgi:phospholipid/cholesterol/gamma-HCH transport system ATP-binding protein
MEKRAITKLSFDNVCMGYDGDEILTDVNIEMPCNSIVNINGERGSGKSTLLRIIAGLVNPTKGRFLINDNNVGELSFEEFLPYRLNIGFGFDYGGLLNNRTVLENLMLPLTYHNLLSYKKSQERVQEYLDLFNLIEIQNKRPSEISGGMRKESCVIRSFLTNPEVLLLDDPTTGMSSEAKQILIRLINEKIKMGILKHVFVVTEDDHFLGEFPIKEMYLNKNKLKVAA